MTEGLPSRSTIAVWGGETEHEPTVPRIGAHSFDGSGKRRFGVGHRVGSCERQGRSPACGPATIISRLGPRKNPRRDARIASESGPRQSAPLKPHILEIPHRGTSCMT